ncbi:MAG TPA: AMP-binding protein [Pirellulales bacterium]|jgi:acyl-[acyl-carrier-protein]-phospholipid O-acyltransferase/long-chain-fatty-acid--[acyl-carrier-protein] ligase|nr:AMP-binding protein [Pirellulales bacterium]
MNDDARQRNSHIDSTILPRRMLRQCRRRLFKPKVCDSTGADLTGGEVLMRTLLLRRVLRREVLADDERYVGLVLPPSAGGVLSNAALALDGRVAVNLNFTASAAVMNSCIRQCGIRHVLTSRKVMEKLDLKLDTTLVYLEDFREKLSTLDKAWAATVAYVLPLPIVERMLGLHRVGPDDLLTVIFTSGSTGEPKGVMLSHHNVGSNVDAIDWIVRLKPHDVLLGSIPLFHSLGYTTTMWTVLTLEPKGAYHPSPLDAHGLGKLARKQRATIIITAPTFLRSYARRCEAEDFASLEVAVAGAEKLPVDLCDAFEEKFGVRPVEGYGATELSPLVSVNVPASRASETGVVVAKEGTVGRPVPGVKVKVLSPEDRSPLPRGTPGLLWVTGPNVMRGYFNQPELTAKVIVDGWYNTGDIATIDADGFITITGRESRFSKLGGEMVPHLRIEEALQQALGDSDEGELSVVVTAVPDPRKGERLVVLHTALKKSPQELAKALAAEGLPNLWIPSADSFYQVDEIPILGTGKLDLKRMNELARRLTASGK